MHSLFPCGSVTGAPKIRAMEIIRELEEGPRGVYCGAIGHIAPDGRMRFSVAIRTVTAWPDGQVVCNVGSGVVANSTVREEYEECLLKARFLSA
jgi:anthranilate/para-aminobenzoate synthase component I